MPIYEYKCSSCDINFEEVLPFNREVTPPCPKCNKQTNVVKKISLPAQIRFIGTGFTLGGDDAITSSN